MNRQILKLAIPNIISNLSIPLLSTVDIALMGRQADASYIGAIALGAVVFNFVYWSFGFLRMGTTGLTAQAFGHQNRPELMDILARALTFAFVSGVCLVALQYPIFHTGLSLLDGSEAVENLAWTYCSIRIWDAPATLGLYALMGWFFGMQNAIYPLILTVFINAVNITANFILVYHFNMTADGVALGTVMAQYSGLLLGIGLWLYKYSDFLKHFSLQTLQNIAALKSFLTLNRDIFIRTFCLLFVIAFFQNQSAAQDDVTLAINSVLLQFFAWVSYGIDGFAYASESLIGKYVGAKNARKYKETVRYSFYWGFGLSALYSLIYGFFGMNLLAIFSNQPNIIEAAKEFLIWIVILPLVSAASFVWDGIYIGLTASKAMRNTMILATLVFLIGFYGLQLFGFSFDNDTLWIVFLVFMASRGIIQTFWYLFKMKKFRLDEV